MPPAPRRTTILIVEDDTRLRTFYRTVLVAAGYLVVSAEDGIRALRYVELERPDLVVLDLDLPRLGGRDVQREINESLEEEGERENAAGRKRQRDNDAV